MGSTCLLISVAENQQRSELWPLESVAGSSQNAQAGACYMKNNVRLCCFPAYPHTEASHKQKKICGPGIAALTECLYRHFSFNGQNVWHSGLSWRLSSSAISKCTLSGALLLHTIEKSLRGGGFSLCGLQKRIICHWSETNKNQHIYSAARGTPSASMKRAEWSIGGLVGGRGQRKWGTVALWTSV